MNTETVSALREALSIFRQYRDDAADQLAVLTDAGVRSVLDQEFKLYTSHVKMLDALLDQ